MVEAGVRARQHFAVLPMSTHIELHCAKAEDRCSVTASGECKELFSLLIVKVFVDYFPEPLRLQALSCVPLDEPTILLPFFEVKYS